MISTPEKRIPQEKYPVSAMTPINIGTTPAPKTKAMGMTKETTIFRFSGVLMDDNAANPEGKAHTASMG